DADTADWWTIEVHGRKATSHRGRVDDAAATVHIGLADFVRVAAGELHPIRALVEGRAEVDGDVVLAVRITDMFGAAEPVAAGHHSESADVAVGHNAVTATVQRDEETMPA
ncbi:MAG: sterol transfer family, partial [Actinomycetota bacterium]|nr:sterol transfer family [Actinomycetota bacterium]